MCQQEGGDVQEHSRSENLQERCEEDPGNYKPVSLTSPLGKRMEKVQLQKNTGCCWMTFKGK